MAWAALAAAGMGMLGSEANKSASRQEIESQERFAKEGITWRVKDAENAGVSPLYALGASVPTYSPVSRFDGQGYEVVGNAINQYAATKRQASMDVLNKAALRAATEKDQAQAAYWQAQAAKAAQDLVARRPLPDSQVTVRGGISGQVSDVQLYPVERIDRGLESNPLLTEAVEVKPGPQMSSAAGDRARVAGNPPGWQRYVLGYKNDGSPIVWDAPSDESGSLSQATQDMPVWMQVMMFMRNMGWLDQRQSKAEKRRNSAIRRNAGGSFDIGAP